MRPFLLFCVTIAILYFGVAMFIQWVKVKEIRKRTYLPLATLFIALFIAGLSFFITRIFN